MSDHDDATVDVSMKDEVEQWLPPPADPSGERAVRDFVERLVEEARATGVNLVGPGGSAGSDDRPGSTSSTAGSRGRRPRAKFSSGGDADGVVQRFLVSARGRGVGGVSVSSRPRPARHERLAPECAEAKTGALELWSLYQFAGLLHRRRHSLYPTEEGVPRAPSCARCWPLLFVAVVAGRGTVRRAVQVVAGVEAVMRIRL